MESKVSTSDTPPSVVTKSTAEATTVVIVSNNALLLKMMRNRFKDVTNLEIIAYQSLQNFEELNTERLTLLIEDSFYAEHESDSLSALKAVPRSAVVCAPLTSTLPPPDVNRISFASIEQTDPQRLSVLLESLQLKGLRLGIENQSAITETIKRFFELPLIGMVRINTSGLILEANKAFALLMDSSVPELVNTEFIRCVHSKNVSGVRESLRTLVADECGTMQLEMRCALGNAESKYCIGCLATVRNESGRVDSILVALLDITDRRSAEKELRRKEMYLRQVIDILPHLVFAKDKEGRFTLCNQAVAQLFGVDIKDLIGKRDRDLNPFPRETERFQKEDERVLKEGTAIVIPEEPLHHLSSDSIRWYQTVKKPIRNENGIPVEVLGVSTDLTERRRAEHALRSIVSGTASKTAEEFFRSLVHHLAEVLDTRFAFIAEVNKESGIANTLAFWEAGNYGENLSYALSHGPTNEIFNAELKLFEKNVTQTFKKDRFLSENSIESYMGAPIFNSAGDPLGVLVVMDTKPMVEWLPAQSILRIFAERAGAELERLANETETRELQRQLLQSQKMEAIGQLAAGIAHDLNNALGAVVGHLQLIKTNGELQPDLDKSVNVALGGCERASSLIEHLLGFSRQGKYNIESLSLSKVVRETITFLGRVVSKDITIKIVEEYHQIQIQADHAQIQQALTNLVINASQAMQESGTLTVTLSTQKVTRPKRFNAKAKAGTFARIDIADTGPGIPKKQQEKVFEPFYSTKTDADGTGLGLAMVYGTMQNHGGWVSLDSSPDKGSTFSLFIPVSDKIIREEATASMHDTANLNNGFIMVVDDEPYLVELALTFLKKNGLTGKGFTNPKEAVTWFRNHFSSVDLTILDMKMPDLSGSEVFDLIRTADPAAKVVILSGYIQDEAAQEVLDKGAMRFFQKPLKYPDLMEWIRAHLDDRQDTSKSENT